MFLTRHRSNSRALAGASRRVQAFHASQTAAIEILASRHCLFV
jgi:hypothetical protein